MLFKNNGTQRYQAQHIKGPHRLAEIVVAGISRESVYSRYTAVTSAKNKDIKRHSAPHQCTKLHTSDHLTDRKNKYIQKKLLNKKAKEAIDLDNKVDIFQFSLIQLATNSDSTLCKLRYMIFQGWPNALKEDGKNIWPYRFYWDELAIENRILLMGELIIIPKSMQEEILQKIHCGHHGIEKGKLRIKNCVFWYNVKISQSTDAILIKRKQFMFIFRVGWLIVILSCHHFTK